MTGQAGEGQGEWKTEGDQAKKERRTVQVRMTGPEKLRRYDEVPVG